jgi:hypothetical protein
VGCERGIRMILVEEGEVNNSLEFGRGERRK